MTKSLFFALFLMSASLFSNQKHYVPKAQIELLEETIIVHLEEGPFAIDTLAADRGGIYFYDEMLLCPKCYRPINPKNTCQNPRCGT